MLNNIIEIMPNPIAIFNCDFSDEVKAIFLKSIDDLNETQNIQSDKLKHYGNDLNQSVLYREEFTKLKDWCLHCAREYVVDVLGYNLLDDIMVTDSWINICHAGGFQYPHYHANSFISGTYYINFDEEDHSPLLFRNPKFIESASQPVLQLEKKFSTKYNSDSVIVPRSGSLVLWESHLSHGYHYNKTDNRISLSMNFIPNYITSGKYGFRIQN
jgi:uncharacterized protein (TIGR02466 family)